MDSAGGSWEILRDTPEDENGQTLAICLLISINSENVRSCRRLLQCNDLGRDYFPQGGQS